MSFQRVLERELRRDARGRVVIVLVMGAWLEGKLVSPAETNARGCPLEVYLYVRKDDGLDALEF